MSNKYKMIDLFAGCGGLEDGFLQSGKYEDVAAVEWLKPQVNTLIKRLETKWKVKDAKERVMHFDIQREKELFEGWQDDEFGQGKGLDYFVNKVGGIDIIIGGPPCQAYSVAGRVRDENGMRDDYRNYLFEHYLNVVNRYRPKLFVFENVPGILSAAPDGTPITDLIRKGFEKIGYEIIKDLRVAKVNASDYSVPQNRERMIIVGVDAQRYSNIQVFLKEFYSNILLEYRGNKVFTVRDAIGDLPECKPFWDEEHHNKKTSHETPESDYTWHKPRYHNMRDMDTFRLLAHDIESGKREYDSKKISELYEKKVGSKSPIHRYHVLEPDLPSTTIILKRLSSDTTEMKPVKGLVIGNVQSGKTANMAALMAMAADWGWNMFIVLSGTIENLRQQTQNRLLNDLNCQGNLNWNGLEHLSKKPMLGQRTQDLHFDKTSKQRYFTVCLKNPGRLRGLIQWLQSDGNKQKQMKILVIDDEADQAGINTANVNSSTIRTINRLIRDLVNGKNEKSQEISNKYKAMNYIGYTATPYANILNEAGEDSLYPRNFISTLSVSKEYFGPQQIFGLEGGDYDYDGLDIVRIIDEDDLQAIKEIHEEGSPYVPLALQDAICWFLCGVACMRIWGYGKPISMLIHTSQKTDHHQNIAEAVRDWIVSKDVDEMIRRCEKVWNTETSQFTFEKFREQYPQYDRKDEEINRYPSFEDIRKEITILLSKEPTNIPLDGTMSSHITKEFICVLIIARIMELPTMECMSDWHILRLITCQHQHRRLLLWVEQLCPEV